MTNRFKGLNLIDRVPEELWTEVCNTVQEAVIKTIPKKRNAKRHTDVWGGLEALQIAEKRSERERRKRKVYIHLNAEFQKTTRKDKKTFLRE